MNPKVCFFTVCGGGIDYEFLLGAIDHHAKMGPHIVLDTTPSARARSFKNLPKSVAWVHEPLYGSGWKNFKFVSAIQRAVHLAEEVFDPEVIVQLDSDDFFSTASWPAFREGTKAVVELQYVHWRGDGNPYIFGDSEWHRRIWPAKRGVRIELDPDWPKIRTYNGNPEVHPKMVVPAGMAVTIMQDLCRHHLHFAISKKAMDDEIARGSITGWPHGGTLVGKVPWPERLAAWREEGTLPSSGFE